MNDLSNLNEPKTLPAIWADTRDSGFTMASEPLTCSLLRTLAASKHSARFLELGSGTGLSTAWLLDGMDSGSHLTTVDNDEALLSILKNTWVQTLGCLSSAPMEMNSYNLFTGSTSTSSLPTLGPENIACLKKLSLCWLHLACISLTTCFLNQTGQKGMPKKSRTLSLPWSN